MASNRSVTTSCWNLLSVYTLHCWTTCDPNPATTSDRLQNLIPFFFFFLCVPSIVHFIIQVGQRRRAGQTCDPRPSRIPDTFPILAKTTVGLMNTRRGATTRRALWVSCTAAAGGITHSRLMLIISHTVISGADGGAPTTTHLTGRTPREAGGQGTTDWPIASQREEDNMMSAASCISVIIFNYLHCNFCSKKNMLIINISVDVPILNCLHRKVSMHVSYELLLSKMWTYFRVSDSTGCADLCFVLSHISFLLFHENKNLSSTLWSFPLDWKVQCHRFYWHLLNFF